MSSGTDGSSATCENETLPGPDGSMLRVQCGHIYEPETSGSYPFTTVFDCISLCAQSCVAVTSDYSTCTLIYSLTSVASKSDPRGWSAYKLSAQNSISISPSSGSAASGIFPNTSAGSISTTASTVSATSIASTISTTSATSATSFAFGQSNSPSSNAAQTSSAASVGNSGTSSSPSKSSGGNTGISSGEVAGAAIGAAVGAALIASLLTFFFCRRRRRPNPTPPAAFIEHKPAALHPWEAFLPQSADDSKIANAVRSLSIQIDSHVETYYGNHFDPTLFDRSQGYLGIVDSKMLHQPLATILPELPTPLPLIKHCFTWYILNKLSPSHSPEETLLPAEYGRIPYKLNSTRDRTEEEAAHQAYNYWRVLTSYLMLPHPTQNPDNAGQLGSVRAECVGKLTTAFAPWAKASKDGQENLNSVLNSAASTGLLILSQPSRFEFEWDVLQEDDGRSVIVMPAFLKVADENGVKLYQRQVLVKHRVESL